ncbi:unnamed protein product, partial [Anisakis simplex]|uniref:Condensin complex subunit 2 n=1 Tax=Anisakis simplex TaxID=6269 RepID=A0A0M3JPJ2_ANISI
PFLIHNSSPASDKAPSTNGFDAQFCAQEKSPDSGVVADGDTDTDSTTALEFDRRKSLSEDKPANEKDSADKCADAAAADEDDYEEDNGFISPTSINDHYFTFPRFDRKRRFFDIHAISNCDDQFQKSLAEATERRRCAQIAMKRVSFLR